MITKDSLLTQLNDEITELQNICDNIDQHNKKNKVIRAVLKSGIVVDYALPFLLAAAVFANSQSAKGNTPFKIDTITEKSSIETIDTSYGAHWENISYDYDYDDELLEYSTGWKINESGLYERTITSYRLNKDVDLTDKEKIFAMSKEEIEEELVTTNIETVTKEKLDDEDKIYSEDGIIIINNYETDENSITTTQTSGENIWDTIWWIILALLWGNNFRNIISIIKIFNIKYIRDILKEKMPVYKEIGIEELEEIKRILELKKQNLELLTNSSTEEITDEQGKTYTLRKSFKRG